MRHVVQEWCAAAFERLKIHGFLVWHARLPTPREDANPCEGQVAHGCLVRLALITLLLVIDLRPKGMPGGFSRPLHKRLPQERRTLEAPVDPRFLATAFRDRRDARIFLEFLGRRIAVPLFAKGHEEAWGKDGTGAWQGVKQREGGMVLGAWRDGFIEVGNGRQSDAELGHLRRFERRPVTEEVAKDRGVFVLKPLQDVGKGVFEGTGQTVGEPHFVADEAPAMCDELREGAHRRALGGRAA